MSSAQRLSDSGRGLSKNRIEALTDGIFAVAMTLLILDVKVPKSVRPDELLQGLREVGSECLSFASTFLMLGVYWVGQHNQFHLIRHTDRVVLWINLLFMMTISFVPFSMALLSSYPREPVALAIYGGNLTVIGLVLYGHWWYATYRNRLVDVDLEAHFVRFAARRILIGPAAFTLAIGMAFVSPVASLTIFVATPFIYLLPGKIDRHWSRGHHRSVERGDGEG